VGSLRGQTTFCPQRQKEVKPLQGAVPGMVMSKASARINEGRATSRRGVAVRTIPYRSSKRWIPRQAYRPRRKAHATARSNTNQGMGRGSYRCRTPRQPAEHAQIHVPSCPHVRRPETGDRAQPENKNSTDRECLPPQNRNARRCATLPSFTPPRPKRQKTPLFRANRRVIQMRLHIATRRKNRRH